MRPTKRINSKIPRKQCLVNAFTTCGKGKSFEEQLVRLRACWGPVAFLGHVWGPEASSRLGALHKRMNPQCARPVSYRDLQHSSFCPVSFPAERPRLPSGFLNCRMPAETDTLRRPPVALFMLTRSQSSH